MRIVVPRIFASYRDRVQAPDRVDNIDTMVADLKIALAPGQLTVLEPILRHVPELTKVSIRGGVEVPSGVAQDLMIRLELMSMLCSDTFQEIATFAHNKDYKVSDWHKVNSEVYRLGVTLNSSALETFERAIFFEGLVEGFEAFFTFGQSISEANRRRTQSFLAIEKLDFSFSEFAEALIVAATEWDGQRYRLVNPLA